MFAQADRTFRYLLIKKGDQMTKKLTNAEVVDIIEKQNPVILTINNPESIPDIDNYDYIKSQLYSIILKGKNLL